MQMEIELVDETGRFLNLVAKSVGGERSSSQRLTVALS